MRRYLTYIMTIVTGAALVASGASPFNGRATAAVASPEAVAGQYVFHFAPHTTAQQRAQALAAKHATIVSELPQINSFVVQLPAAAMRAGVSRSEEIHTLKQLPHVTSVEPNYLYHATAEQTDTTLSTPNDPELAQQWGLGTIDAYKAWEKTRGNSKAVIAVVDTGTQLDHPEFAGKILPGYDFVLKNNKPSDQNGHGTHVSGTAAALADNGEGGAGVCPGCSILPVRVLNARGSGSLATVAKGIVWAADHGAKVINLSLGGSGAQTMQDAVDYAWKKGVFLACAAGNESNGSPEESYPAAYPHCYAVGATDQNDVIAEFSNWGTWVKVAAPGVDIFSSWIRSGYNTISGTSMATPHVAGLAGLLSSQGLNNAQIASRICETADKIAGTGKSWECGRIDAARAVNGSTKPAPVKPAPGKPAPVTPAPVTPTPVRPAPVTPTFPPGPVAPKPGSDAIVNGNFENGLEPWDAFSAENHNLITDEISHSGRCSAWLGGYEDAFDSISQTVTVPSGGTLSYWWFMSTEKYDMQAHDFFHVRLLDSNGSVIATLRRLSNISKSDVWVKDQIKLSKFAGKTVTVEFSARTTDSDPTSFFVTEVSLK